MAVRVTCPGCHATLKLDEMLARRSLVCTNCRTEFRVARPGDEEADRTRPDEDNLDTDSSGFLPPRKNVPEPIAANEPPIKKYKRRRRQKRKKGRLDQTPLALRGMALLLVGGLAASFVFLRPLSPQATSVTTEQPGPSDESGASAEAGDASSAASQGRRIVLSAGQRSQIEKSDPHDRFQILWAPRHVVHRGSPDDQ